MSAQPSMRALSRTEFTLAQVGLAAALLANVGATVLGITAAVKPEWAGWTTLTLAVLASVAVWARGFSERFAETANDLLRELDLQDGLGREIDRMKQADMLARSPRIVRWWAARAEDLTYFGSTKPASARRLVENIRESAWWTKQLASDMAGMVQLLVAFLWLAAILTILLPVTGLVSGDAVRGWMPWLPAVILFVISQAPHQAQRRYAAFSHGAGRVQQTATALLENAEPSEARALELASEYHLLRQCAPVVPTAWHWWRRRELNEAWAATVQSAG